MRKLNQATIDLIKEFEGLRLEAYPDPRPNNPIWTIGYGTIRYPNGTPVKKGDKITQAQAEEYLRKDLENFITDVEKLLKVTLNDNQFGALVSFAYNVGSDIDSDTIAEGLGDSTLLKKLNAGDFAGALAEFPKWNKAEGKVLPGLTRRRLAEQKLFSTPVGVVAPTPAPAPVTPVEQQNWLLTMFKKFLDWLFTPSKSEPAITTPTPKEDTLDAKILAINPQIPSLALKAALTWKDNPAVKNKKYILLVDFNKNEKLKRFHMIDMETLKSTDYKVSHGANSDKNKDGLPEKFSNDDGSHESSLGAMVIAEAYASTKFKTCRRIDGLQKGLNDHVRARAIVWHSSAYVNDTEGQPIGDSWGCFAMSEPTAAKLKDLIGGCLLFAWDDSLKG